MIKIYQKQQQQKRLIFQIFKNVFITSEVGNEIYYFLEAPFQIDQLQMKQERSNLNYSRFNLLKGKSEEEEEE